MTEPTHQAILEAIAAHRAESKERWRSIDRRLDGVDSRLGALPAMQAELTANTVLTKQYAEDQAFKAGLRKRWQHAGMLAGATAGLVGLWMALKSLFGGGPPMGPHP